MSEPIYFCQRHYDEFAQRWDGDPARAYPGQEVKIDPNRCSHLECIRAAQSDPWAYRKKSPGELDLLFGVLCSDCGGLITIHITGKPRTAKALVMHKGKACEPAPLR